MNKLKILVSAVKGNAKTKIFSLFMDWIGDDMSQLKLIEYQSMHDVGHPSMCMAYMCKGKSWF